MKFMIPILLLVLPAAQASPLTNLKPVGNTSLTWLFWKIYDIELLTESGQYEYGTVPLALSITYARDINADKLVSTTISEWERQQIEWQSEWSQKLNDIWPDIRSGDEIILRVDDQRESHFYFNKQPIGSIEDTEFTLAFLSIWLSDKSRNPELTKQLTGSF